MKQNSPISSIRTYGVFRGVIQRRTIGVTTVVTKAMRTIAE